MNKEQVTAYLKNYELSIKEFLVFMRGQTTSFNPTTKETIYYHHDVDRFISECIGNQLGQNNDNDILFD